MYEIVITPNTLYASIFGKTEIYMCVCVKRETLPWFEEGGFGAGAYISSRHL